MEGSEIVFNLINTLSSPIILLENKDNNYSVVFANEVMQNLLKTEESSELILTDDFFKVMNLYKDEADSDNFMLHNIEIFTKLYNISFCKKSNHIFITFIEIAIEKLFENITFHDIGGACNAMIVVINDEGKVVDFNDCFLNFVGMKKDDIYSKDFFDTFIPGDKEVLNHYLSELMSKDSASQHFVTPMIGLNKEIYKINWQVSKIVKQNKNFIIAVGSDISKFIDKSNDFKRQLQSIKIGFEYFPLAIGHMNAEGIFTKMNPKFMKMFHIKDDNNNIKFETIPFLENHIGFSKMSEHIKLIKEMSFKIDLGTKEKPIAIKVDIRMLSGKKESSKFYILVAQKIK